MFTQPTYYKIKLGDNHTADPSLIKNGYYAPYNRPLLTRLKSEARKIANAYRGEVEPYTVGMLVKVVFDSLIVTENSLVHSLVQAIKALPPLVKPCVWTCDQLCTFIGEQTTNPTLDKKALAQIDDLASLVIEHDLFILDAEG